MLQKYKIMKIMKFQRIYENKKFMEFNKIELNQDISYFFIEYLKVVWKFICLKLVEVFGFSSQIKCYYICNLVMVIVFVLVLVIFKICIISLYFLGQVRIFGIEI